MSLFFAMTLFALFLFSSEASIHKYLNNILLHRTHFSQKQSPTARRHSILSVSWFESNIYDDGSQIIIKRFIGSFTRPGVKMRKQLA
jgi:hypothetical protein